MKFPSAYYLLLLYITIMFRPLMPMVGDALSHTFSEAMHVAAIHAKYGSNHLEKELSDTTSDNSGKHQNNLKAEAQVLVHVATGESNDDLNLTSLIKNYFYYNSFIFTSVFTSIAGPPPKFPEIF